MVSLEHVQAAGGTAIGYRVDEYQCAPIVEQIIGEVHAPDSVVDRVYFAVRGLPDDVAQYLGSETVVSEENVADAGYQYAWRDIAFDPAVTCS